MYTNILLGCDPEVFIKDKQGKAISSIGRIGGSKHDPLPIGNGCALQEDNVSVEFNIPPAAFLGDWFHSIKSTMDVIKSKLNQDQLEMLIQAAVVFDQDQLNTSAAWEMGCEPDYDAYTGTRNPRPSVRTGMRTAAGHIHIGYDNPTRENQIALVKTMDVFTAVTSVIINDDPSTRERMSLYGKAGAFRPKNYGVEYRTLPNFWLRSDHLIEWAWNQTQKAVHFLNSGREIEASDYELIQTTIKDQDFYAATDLIQKYRTMELI